MRDIENDDVGTCPRCGEDSTGFADVCHNCREQDWIDENGGPIDIDPKPEPEPETIMCNSCNYQKIHCQC